jgi:VWFA-related protein
LKPPLKRITDAVFAAAMDLKTQPKDRRKVVLLISDGNDTGKNEASYQGTLRLLLDNDIAVYGISNDEAPLLRHVEVTNVMPKFADDTGGSMFYSFKRETLENIYPALTEQVRNQYELAYSPKRETDDSVFKSIEVKVNRPGVRVIARQGYYSVSVVSPAPESK